MTNDPLLHSPPRDGVSSLSSPRRIITMTPPSLLDNVAVGGNKSNNNNNDINRERSQSMGTPYLSPIASPFRSPPIGVSSGGGRGGGGGRSLSLSPTHQNRYGISGNATVGGLQMPFFGNHANKTVTGANSMTNPSHEMQKAMESISQQERQRIKQCEQEEQDMTADQLRQVLKKERQRMLKLSTDLAQSKSLNVQSQAQAEIIEEGRINNLMRRLEALQYEKGRLIVELEREEEMLTNTLQKKLTQVRNEKAQLEKLIEREQISHNTLQTKLTGLQQPTTTVPVTSDTQSPMETTSATTSSQDDNKNNESSMMMDALVEDEDEEEVDEEGEELLRNM